MEANAPREGWPLVAETAPSSSFKKGKNTEALTGTSDKQNSHFPPPYLVELVWKYLRIGLGKIGGG